MSVMSPDPLLPMAHNRIPYLVGCALLHQTSRNCVPQMVKLHAGWQASFLAHTHDDTLAASAVLLGRVAHRDAATRLLDLMPDSDCLCLPVDVIPLQA